MRLLYLNEGGQFSLTDDLLDSDAIPDYAILSHTWGKKDEEVSFKDLTDLTEDTPEDTTRTKPGWEKLRFCAKQAAHDKLKYFWIDTCCINKDNLVELTTALNSMFRFYQNATKCYVYLSELSTSDRDPTNQSSNLRDAEIWRCRWFTRGWTLQELIAPKIVDFFCCNGRYLGNRKSLEQGLHITTGIALEAFRGKPLAEFTIDERMSWADSRVTTLPEDRAYCLLGVFNVSMAVIYGEGVDRAFVRLRNEIGTGRCLLPSSAADTQRIIDR
jgi:hypothetical protein